MDFNWKFWTWGKKQTTVELKSVTSEIKTELKVEEPPRPTKRKAMMSVTVINNKTDKEYVIESINDFGLTWGYSEGKHDKNYNYVLLRINQYTSAEREDNWIGVSRFLDFSVKGTVWKEFDIVYEDEKKEEKEEEKK
jgi:hypothetical protein